MSEDLLDFMYDSDDEINVDFIPDAPPDFEVSVELGDVDAIITDSVPDLTDLDQGLAYIRSRAPAKPLLPHEIEMWEKIDAFEKRAWSKKNQGLTTGWAAIDKAFDGGLMPGFIIIGGDSNLGKSGFITQMAQQIALQNPDAYVMDFSLDDPIADKIPRVVGSINKVLLNAVKCPNNYTTLPLMLQRREVGLNKLKTMCNSYNVYDSNFSTYVEDIEDEIKRKIVDLDSACLDKKIVVCIDNMHDLNIKSQPGLTDKQKYDTIAQWCSDTATRYNLILIASAELKKLNSIRRPALDDIREAVKIKYEAKAILLVYNEVHYKGEAANVYFMRSNDPLKQPVFEVHFAKNKFSTYKGRIFFEFYPEMARFEEVDDQTAKTYASVVFGS